MANKKPAKYRHVIDALVEMCQTGAGQISATKVLADRWPLIDPNHAPMGIPEVDIAFSNMARANNEVADFVSRLSDQDRKVLARMLAGEVFSGVFETLKTLERFEVEPFLDGYEGSPFEDLVGRNEGWQWPE
jgi:hypothetical protein